MLPAGPLMKEHRLIEKMVALMADSLAKAKKTGAIDGSFLSLAIDFLKVYADRTHHGKEEDILFKALSKKPMSPELKKIMAELIEEHAYARERVKRLCDGAEKYAKGDTRALKDIIQALADITNLYPRHIEKEDKSFFLPVMDYLKTTEQQEMIKAFWEFDRKMVHEKYTGVVEACEKKCAS